jgi:hypothetical protein
MLIVNAPLKREYIISLLNAQTIDGITFTYVRSDNMKLYFNYTPEDSELAKRIAKTTIKASEFGPALFFNVEIHD